MRYVLFLCAKTPMLAQANIYLSGKSVAIINGQSATSTSDNTHFGSQAVCNGSVAHTFTIENLGNTTLTLSSITSSVAAFSFGPLPSNINPGQSADLSIYFDPAALGNFVSTLTIINNDPSQDPFTFEVEGDGVVPQTDIMRGNSLDLDGIDDYIDCTLSLNNAVDNKTAFTLEAWIKADNTNDEQVIFSNTTSGISQGIELRIQSGNIWLSYRDNNNTLYNSPAVSISANEWYHVAGILNSDSIGIFLNGNLSYNSINGTGISPSSNPFLIGGNNNFGSYNFGGSLDELRLWDDCRTSDEVREHMHLTLNGCENNLVAYYQCNASSGTTLLNRLGNGHNGSLNNGPQWLSSTINLGNDVLETSTSETIHSVPQGSSTLTFNQANVSMNIIRHSGTEDITANYQTFSPNGTGGSFGYYNFDNITWTINQSKQETFVADYTFTLPSNTFTYLIASKYALYWRPMNSDADWTKIAIATALSDHSIRFGKIGTLGQFMIVQESANLTTEVRGNMIDLDGSNDYINAGNHSSLDLRNNYTLETWFKTTTISSSEKVLMSKELSMYNEGFVLSVVNNDIQFYFPNMGNLSYTGVVQDQWHHVAATFNYGTISLYLDGVEVASGYMEFINNSTEDFYIGASHLYNGGGADNYFEGAIDELRIWSINRTEAQIRENMHLTLRGTEADLISYYQFNNDQAVGNPNGVIDAMNSNNATAYGMSATTYQPSEVAVGGGFSDRITVAAIGPLSYALPWTDVQLSFGTSTPDGEIVVYRIESEKPHGWNSILGDVDNEYFIVENFGNNSNFSNLTDLSFNRIGYISEDDVALTQGSSPLLLYKRGDNDYGPTWGNSKGGAASATAGSCGSVSFDSNNNLFSFSQFVVVNVNNNSLLPIDLSTFDAERTDDRNVELNWAIADDQKAKQFDLEVLYEGQTDFKGVVSLVHQEAEMTRSYTYNHPNKQTVVSYYRLKIIANDGSIHYSPVRAVDGRNGHWSSAGVNLFPSPVSDHLNIELPLAEEDQKVALKIVNVQGITIWSQQQISSEDSTLTINHLDQLNPAVYILVIQTGGQQISRKFIKA
jgi:hypothetical protein